MSQTCSFCPQAAPGTSPHADDVLVQMTDNKQLRRSEAFAVLSILIAPQDALLHLLLADSVAAGQRNSTGAMLQHEALVAAAAIFGAEGERLRLHCPLCGARHLRCCLHAHCRGELADYNRNSVHAENPFASDEAVAGVYVYLHFKQFLKLYNSPAHDRAALDSACGHVQVCLPELKTLP